jgi:hypothetical protein
VEKLAEETAAAELEREGADDERIVMDSAAPPDEEVGRRFFERLAEKEAALEARTEEKVQEADTFEERATAQLFDRTFYEAYWILRTGAFPDGRPLNFQCRRRADLWTIWLNALDRLFHGVG